jgi:hypothetical protein
MECSQVLNGVIMNKKRACFWREAPPFSPRSHSYRESISSSSSSKSRTRSCSRARVVVCERAGADGAAGQGFWGRALDYDNKNDFDITRTAPHRQSEQRMIWRARERDTQKEREGARVASSCVLVLESFLFHGCKF